MNDELKKRIEAFVKEDRDRHLNPLIKAYTAFFLAFDIIDNYVNTMLNETDISRAGRNILHILIINGGSMTATEISKQAWRSTYSVVRVIDTLERAGYVIRVAQNHGGDRRKKIISITEKGIDAAEELVKISEEFLCYQVLGGLTEEQIDIFFQILEKIRKHVFDLVEKNGNQYLYRKM
ncbi:winged helix DNA-binding protein [bacterium]|nr:winged helix DNA-binding protein [bacterium]